MYIARGIIICIFLTLKFLLYIWFFYVCPLRLLVKMLNMTKVSRYTGHLRRSWLRYGRYVNALEGDHLRSPLIRAREQEIEEVREKNEEVRWEQTGRWRWEISKLTWRRSVAHVRLRLVRHDRPVPTWYIAALYEINDPTRIRRSACVFSQISMRQSIGMIYKSTLREIILL